MSIHPLEAIAIYASNKGVANINTLPGCWEIQVDEAWWFAVNGHEETLTCSRGAEVRPFTAYVEYNEWPAGYIDTLGGLCAAGAEANIDTFIAALGVQDGAGVCPPTSEG